MLTTTWSRVFGLFTFNRLWAQIHEMTADTENERRDFTRFNGTNFPQYKFAVVLKLRLFNLEQIVLGTETKPVEVS